MSDEREIGNEEFDASEEEVEGHTLARDPSEDPQRLIGHTDGDDDDEVEAHKLPTA